jgi:RNA polymerase sigma factor (sigma-70 family)
MAKEKTEAVLTLPKSARVARPIAEASDRLLLKWFSTHRDRSSEAAFAALVRRHGPMVLRVCTQIVGDRHTAEDAFQATFLILARKAGKIREPELLGHWLYGVALRTAREARMRVDRRRRHETGGVEALEAGSDGLGGRPEMPLVSREEFEILHEELSRLPERYRVPLVLCELEGLSYQEAARRLRCPVGTVGVRLRRARERLRMRLTRRGLAPTAGLLGAYFGMEAASAPVPAMLVGVTVRAAASFAAGQAATAGLASAPVVSLSQAVLMTMALTRLKLATGLVLALGMSTSVGWLVAGRQKSVEPAAVPLGLEMTAVPADPQAVAGPAARVDFGKSTETVLRVARGVANVMLASHRVEEAPRAIIGQAIREERARGELLFSKEWIPDDPASRGGDGLGPVYNETSCVACHGLGAPGGGGPEGKNVILLTATATRKGQFKELERIHPGFHGTRSVVLHRFGTSPGYARWRQGFTDPGAGDCNASPKPGEDSVVARIQRIRAQTTPDHRAHERALRVQAPPGTTLSLSQRNTPALFGLGRIDSIPTGLLEAAAARQPREVRGRLNRSPEGRAGRFGWKAQIASLHEFVRAACASELGLEVPGHSQASSPLAPGQKARGLDLSEQDCDDLVAYLRALPAPVVVDPEGLQGAGDLRQGRRHFVSVGCAECHTPSLGDVRGIYSDLLLHDMGPSLSDSGTYYGIDGPLSPGGGPLASEWRTPPLWGFRDSAPYLHDGRAQTLEEAVALHDGQGLSSAHRFFALNPFERSQIEMFLKSLVAPSAAASPGVVLAADMESRIEAEERYSPETLARKRREEALAREEQLVREAKLREQVALAAKRARAQFPAARNLEKMGKIDQALDLYRKVLRHAPDSEEGRFAATRTAALSTRVVSH